MNKEYQTKFLAVIALVLSVVAMTVGFAAFSTMLNVSSSASVTPTASDFKVKIYGATEEELYAYKYEGKYDSVFTPEIYDSETSSFVFSAAAMPASIAIIDNTNMKISNIDVDVNTTTGLMYLGYTWYFMIANTGKYDAYFTTVDNSAVGKTCVGDVGTTQSLVDVACDEIEYNIDFFDANKKMLSPNEKHKIEKDGYVYMAVSFIFGERSLYADGNYDVLIEDIVLSFTTA